jgi:hypothetical protein
MIGWIEDHFSVQTWPATFDAHGEFSLLRIDFDWSAGTYYGGQVALFGLNLSVAYWPDGKYSGDPLDGDLANLFENGNVMMSVKDYRALTAAADELAKLKAERGA